MKLMIRACVFSLLFVLSQLAYCADTVSLLSVLSNPEKYDGKEIRTEGYLVLYHGMLCIYPYSEDAKFLNVTNCIEIITNEKVDSEKAGAYAKKSHHHVTLQAYFSASDKGTLGAFAGTFHEIAGLDIKEPRE